MKLHENVEKITPAKWVDRYADDLYAYALSRTGLPHIAEDLVQDTFLSALEKADTFEGPSTEKTWLTAILKNKVVDHFRKSGRTTKPVQAGSFFDPVSGHWKDEHYPESFMVEDAANTEELAKILALCLDQLPSLWQMAFRLRVHDELGTKEIGRKLSISTSNCWVIAHRTKLQLRQCLEKHWLA